MDSKIQSLINKGYDPQLVQSLISFTSEEVQNLVTIYMTQVRENSQIKSSTSPHVYYVGGQPGCGKSSAMESIRERESINGLVNIEMDAYRTANPRIKQIKQAIADFYAGKDKEDLGPQISADLVAFTQGFADAVADEYTRQLFNNGYNIAIESTLRHPEGKIKQAEAMRAANPNAVVSVVMVGVSQELAMNGAISRAEQMAICMDKLIKDASAKGITVSRVSRGKVDRSYYDSVCADLPSSIEKLSQSPAINGTVQIMDRQKNILYDKHRDGMSVSARSIQESALNGEIAKRQLEAHAREPQRYFGVQAFIKENASMINQVYGSVDNAKLIFEEEVKKIKGKMMEQVGSYSQVVSMENNIYVSSANRAM